MKNQNKKLRDIQVHEPVVQIITDEVPPSAPMAETQILGGIIQEPGAFAHVASVLKPEMFYSGAHQQIYAALVDMDRARRNIDLVTFIQHLRETGKLEAVGGAYFVTQLTNGVVGTSNIADHALIVVKMWSVRKLINVGTKMLTDCYSLEVGPREIISNTQSAIEEIEYAFSGTQKVTYQELLFQRMQFLLSNDGTNPDYILSGIRSVDKIIVGFMRKQLYVIASRPAMGKTAFAKKLVDNIAGGTAVQKPKAVGIFSLETSDAAFIDRHLSGRSGITGLDLKRGGLDEKQIDALQNAAIEIFNQKIYAEFRPSITLSELWALARIWVSLYGVEIIFVDYVQIMGIEEQDQRKTREQQVANLVNGLALLAKILNIPVVLFAQLSRQVLSRAGNRPNLGDLRESGSLEQVARTVCFLHRPEYYGETEDEFGPLPKGLTEFIVQKNNEGETGTARLILKAPYSDFEDTVGPEWQGIDTTLF